MEKIFTLLHALLKLLSKVHLKMLLSDGIRCPEGYAYQLPFQEGKTGHQRDGRQPLVFFSLFSLVLQKYSVHNSYLENLISCVKRYHDQTYLNIKTMQISDGML